MTKDEFLKLYQRFQNGECTQEEIEQLFAYQDEMKLETGEWDLPEDEQLAIRETIRARLNENIQPAVPIRRRLPTWIRWSAAAVLAGLAIGIYYVTAYRKQTEQLAVQQTAAKQNSAQKTYLTLGNGQVISLTDAAKGNISNTAGIVARKQEDGWVAFETVASDHNSTPDTNKVETPYGERFAITLADGSRVWLNATSGLRFPAWFTGNIREVYLTGEACFEVKANPSQPFIVHVNGMAVRATGTFFNIKAYAEEQRAIATLVEGKVQVKMPAKETMLTPGLQIIYDTDNGRSRVQTANITTVLAWKNGVFAYENESIATILYELGRWYNKEIVFVKGNMNTRFTYKLQRGESFEEALERLKLTGSIQLQTTGNKIMVTIP